MFIPRPQPTTTAGSQRRRWDPAARFGLVLVNLLGVSALGCRTPTGRYGMPDPGAPVAMADPFPGDQCVPRKGVDPGHSGYVRPQWRILGQNDPLCCVTEFTSPPSVPASRIEELPPARNAPPGVNRVPVPADDRSSSSSGGQQLRFSDIQPPPRKIRLDH